MPFCPSCGAPVEGRFCAKCGTPMGAEAGGARPVAPGSGAPAAGGMADNVASTLCYVLGFITGILFLVLEPHNKNRKVRFHAFQSIFLSVAWFAIWFVFSTLVTAMFSFGLMFMLMNLLSLAFFVLWVYMLVMTYQDKKIVLPVIGPLAEKQA